jgi:hypothetical protein
MPLNSDSLPTRSRQDFCLALKSARERKGISLVQIADATKIPSYLFAGLERSDLRRWPKGLFRRSFFRDYARMIGLPVAEACEEFVRLFPDDEHAAVATAPAITTNAGQADEVRLVLDEAWHAPGTSPLSRLLIGLVDGGAIVFAAAIAWMAGLDRPETTAIVGLAYFFLATVLLGESPAKWAVSKRGSILDTLRRRPAAIAAAWTTGIDSIKGLFESSEMAEPEQDPEMPAWISDARRVASAPSSRLRVRIKVPQ